MVQENTFFNNDDVLKRFHSLMEVFKIAHGKLGWDDNITINDALLLEVAAAYYRDMNCYKESNGTLIGDRYKKAAFLIKWIAKIKPIQVAYFQGITKNHLLSNTVFAIFAGLNMLEINMKNISIRYYTHLIYFIEYRNISALQFATQLYLLERALNKKLP